jgi:hypothetical protein
MSWVITGSEKTPVDPQFGSVSLLLHGNGTNGSTTITDSSPSPKTVTAFGNAQISTAQSKFGGASLLFDGTGDNLTVPDNGSFTMGTVDFTIEFWARPVSGGQTAAMVTTGSPTDFQGFFFGLLSGSLFLLADGDGLGPVWDVALNAASIGVDSWTHVAAVRLGNTFTVYKDGVQAATGTSSILLKNSNNILTVGGRGQSAQYFNGYIDDLRITKGIARYTANFTPPTAPFPDI